jgi:hypothetical protein
LCGTEALIRCPWTRRLRREGSAAVQSSLIGKVQKAKQYAQEPERVRFTQFSISFAGENGDHVVGYHDGAWQCTCHFFAGWKICCHTMAVEKLLGVMVPVKQTYPDSLSHAEAAVAAGA